MFRFFFFKQKTAYEMRISDWSSDVCSSDLDAEALNKAWGGRSGNRPVRCFLRLEARISARHVQYRPGNRARREIIRRSVLRVADTALSALIKRRCFEGFAPVELKRDVLCRGYDQAELRQIGRAHV